MLEDTTPKSLVQNDVELKLNNEKHHNQNEIETETDLKPTVQYREANNTELEELTVNVGAAKREVSNTRCNDRNGKTICSIRVESYSFQVRCAVLTDAVKKEICERMDVTIVTSCHRNRIFLVIEGDKPHNVSAAAAELKILLLDGTRNERRRLVIGVNGGANVDTNFIAQYNSLPHTASLLCAAKMTSQEVQLLNRVDVVAFLADLGLFASCLDYTVLTGDLKVRLLQAIAVMQLCSSSDSTSCSSSNGKFVGSENKSCCSAADISADRDASAEQRENERPMNSPAVRVAIPSDKSLSRTLSPTSPLSLLHPDPASGELQQE